MSQFFGANLEQLPDQRSWDPRAGWIVHRGWKGSPAAVYIQQQALVNAGIPFDHEINEEGGYQVVTAHYGALDDQPTDTPLTDQWTLEGNDIEQDIWTHPKTKAIFASMLDGGGFPTDDYVSFRQDIDKLLNGELQLTDVFWWLVASSNKKKFVRALLRGETSYTVGQFVLKNVKLVAANYSIKPDYTRVGKVMTGDLLTSVYQIPNTIKFNLPAGYWMERTPTIEEEAPDQYKVSREWWNFTEYDDFLYDQATS